MTSIGQIDLNALAERLDSISSVKEDGSVSFAGFEFMVLRPILEHAFDFLEEISDVARTQIAHKAANCAAQSGGITGKSLRLN